MSLLREKYVVIMRKYVVLMRKDLVITRKDVVLTRKDLVIMTKLSGKKYYVWQKCVTVQMSLLASRFSLVNQKYSTTCEVRLQKESVIFCESEYSLIQKNYSNELLIFSKPDSYNSISRIPEWMSLIMSRFCSVNQKHTEQFVLSDSGVNDFNESVLFNEYSATHKVWIPNELF